MIFLQTKIIFDKIMAFATKTIFRLASKLGSKFV